MGALIRAPEIFRVTDKGGLTHITRQSAISWEIYQHNCWTKTQLVGSLFAVLCFSEACKHPSVRFCLIYPPVITKAFIWHLLCAQHSSKDLHVLTSHFLMYFFFFLKDVCCLSHSSDEATEIQEG